MIGLLASALLHTVVVGPSPCRGELVVAGNIYQTEPGLIHDTAEICVFKEAYEEDLRLPVQYFGRLIDIEPPFYGSLSFKSSFARGDKTLLSSVHTFEILGISRNAVFSEDPVVDGLEQTWGSSKVFDGKLDARKTYEGVLRADFNIDSRTYLGNNFTEEKVRSLQTDKRAFRQFSLLHGRESRLDTCISGSFRGDGCQSAGLICLDQVSDLNRRHANQQDCKKCQDARESGDRVLHDFTPESFMHYLLACCGAGVVACCGLWCCAYLTERRAKREQIER